MSKKQAPDPLFVLRAKHANASAVHTVRFVRSDLLAGGYEDGHVALYNLRSRRPSASWCATDDIDETKKKPQQNSAILQLAPVDDECTRLLVQSRTGVVQICDVESQKSLVRFATDSLAFCRCALNSSNDNSDNKSGQKADAHRRQNDESNAVGSKLSSMFAASSSSSSCSRSSLLSASRLVASATGESGRALSLWSVDDGSLVSTIRDGTEPQCLLMALQFCGNDRVVCGYEDGRIGVYDVRASRWLIDAAMPSGGTLQRRDEMQAMMLSMAVTAPTGGAVAWSGVVGDVKRLSTFRVDESRRSIDIVEQWEPAPRKPGYSAVAIRGDERLFASGGWDGRVRIYTMRAKPRQRPLAVLCHHTDTVHSIAFSPFDQSLLAAASADHQIAVWQLYK
jgi:WD40 repeat protein